MASYTPWLNEHRALVDETGSAKAPSKDFFQIFVTPSEFVYRVWKVVPPTRPNNHPAPNEYRDTWEEFRTDERLHSEIHRVAGDATMTYLFGLADGKLDYLPRLPKNVLIKIILMLDLESIARLSITSKLFRTLCQCDDVWKVIFMRHNRQPITHELLSVVDLKGWRNVFFTSKLQLQMQMRRAAQTEGKVAFMTEQDEGMK
ncbi:hypothetical protein ACOMHN_003776 [Nucella lapillus]